MRGEIEPPSKLIVGLFLLPKGGGCLLGGFTMRGVDRTKSFFVFNEGGNRASV